LHCQNYSLSQLGSQIGRAAHRLRQPEEIVGLALQQGCRSISYTYSEPTIFIEFALDCARLARERGLKNIFVSNGYMTREAAEALSSILEGINIDIKSFSESFYRQTCGGGLQQVLDNVRFFFEHGVWVELTTLVIPGLNDSDDELRSIAGFIASCDPAIPWHVSAFRPTFKMTERPPTSAESLLRARQIGLEAGLHHVYVGNIVGGGGEDTRCQDCGEIVIRRHGFSIRQNLMSRNCCPFCSAAISGVW
jgi:pyruvate formate lyase activating enzyme